MKDMIERIMKMDKAAREVTQKVQKEKIGLEQEIKNLKESIRSEYLERARKRIENNRIEEQKLAREKISSIQQSGERILDRLTNTYKNNKESWVDSIVKRVVGE